MSHGIRRYLRETRFYRNQTGTGDSFLSNPNKRRADLSLNTQEGQQLQAPNPIDPWLTGWEPESGNDWGRGGGGYKSVSAPAFSVANNFGINNLQKDKTVDNTLLP
jgi:hypothetical protein